jgi:hypothetical protein
MGDFGLDFENGLELPISQGDRPVIENELQIVLEFRLIIFQRGDLNDRVLHVDFRIDEFYLMDRLGGSRDPLNGEDRSRLQRGHLGELFLALDDHLDESCPIAQEKK